MTTPRKPLPSSSLIRAAVVCTLMGLSCLSTFLWLDFSPWSIGIGIGAGAPLTVVALVLYLPAVIQELRRRSEL